MSRSHGQSRRGQVISSFGPGAQVGLAQRWVMVGGPLTSSRSGGFKFMREFVAARLEQAMVQRPVARIPWRSNLALRPKLISGELRVKDAERFIGKVV